MPQHSALAFSPTLPAIPSARRAVDAWPAVHLDQRELLINNPDERVYEGVDQRGQRGERVVVSVRDLGEDVSASLWATEVERLRTIRCDAAAEVIDAHLYGDRFVVVATRRPPGEPLRTRLWRGPLNADEAAMVLRDALELMVHLHALGLSGSGTWLRTGILSRDASFRRRCLMTAFGTHVDNDVDPVGELHELAVRVATTVGGRYLRGELSLPLNALPVAIEHTLRRALGLVGRPFGSPKEMLASLV